MEVAHELLLVEIGLLREPLAARRRCLQCLKILIIVSVRAHQGGICNLKFAVASRYLKENQSLCLCWERKATYFSILSIGVHWQWYRGC